MSPPPEVVEEEAATRPPPVEDARAPSLDQVGALRRHARACAVLPDRHHARAGAHSLCPHQFYLLCRAAQAAWGALGVPPALSAGTAAASRQMEASMASTQLGVTPPASGAAAPPPLPLPLPEVPDAAPLPLLAEEADDWFYDADGAISDPLSKAMLLERFAEHDLSPKTLVWTSSMAAWEPAERTFALPVVDDGGEAWWYADVLQGKLGPFSFAELRKLIRAGSVRGESRVWNASMASWRAASAVEALARELGAGAGDGAATATESAEVKAADWFFAAAGMESAEPAGPVDTATLRAFAASGGLSPETLVWSAALSDWTALRMVEELSVPDGPASPPRPPTAVNFKLLTNTPTAVRAPTPPSLPAVPPLLSPASAAVASGDAVQPALWHFEDAVRGVRGTASHSAMEAMLLSGTLSAAALLWDASRGAWKRVVDEPVLAGVYIEGELREHAALSRGDDRTSGASPQRQVAPTAQRQMQQRLRSPLRRRVDGDAETLLHYFPQVQTRLALDDDTVAPRAAASPIPTSASAESPRAAQPTPTPTPVPERRMTSWERAEAKRGGGEAGSALGDRRVVATFDAFGVRFSALLVVAPATATMGSCPALLLFTECDAAGATWKMVPKRARRAFAALRPALRRLVHALGGARRTKLPTVRNVWSTGGIDGSPALPYTVSLLPDDVDITDAAVRAEIVALLLQFCARAQEERRRTSAISGVLQKRKQSAAAREQSWK